MKHASITLALLLLAACAPTSTEEARKSLSEGNIGAACTTHEECETPMNYLIRSSCPYTSLCIANSCAVVCPMAFHEPSPQVGENHDVQCTTDADCTCEGYGPQNMKRCACVDGACYAVADQ